MEVEKIIETTWYKVNGDTSGSCVQIKLKGIEKPITSFVLERHSINA